ncbi:Imm42 family immunity protein [Pseudomonas indica]|uniref:Imm42 family immunity protein n=1 Tax=Pseudomonas indica TaxID=137658 RepID=UPI003FD52FE1
MLIGIKEVFGVEYEIDTNHGGVWLFGKLCYWIAGERIGDYDLGTSLRDALFQMKTLIGDAGRRFVDEETFNSSPSDLFHAIDNSIYGEGDMRSGLDIDESARFNISMPIDVFDEWKIYMLENKDKALILYKSSGQKVVSSLLLNQGEFDEAIRRIHDELNKRYDAELG